MTSLREAVQQALEAWDQPHGINYVDFRPYMDALRAALAETERPVTLTKPCGSLGEDVSLCQYPDCAGGQAGTICNNWCPGARK